MPRIVAFVGADGAGKTTQARMLANELSKTGVPAAYWGNAGGRQRLGRIARRLGLRDEEHLLGANGALIAEGTLRWLAIARSLIASRLRRRVAVMDRYAYCQYASIRARSGGHERMARRLYRPFPMPDVTLYLAVPPKEAYQRIEERGTDHEDVEHLSTIDDAYRSLPEAILFTEIDATGSPEEVNSRVMAALATPQSTPSPLPTRTPGL